MNRTAFFAGCWTCFGGDGSFGLVPQRDTDTRHLDSDDRDRLEDTDDGRDALSVLSEKGDAGELSSELPLCACACVFFFFSEERAGGGGRRARGGMRSREDARWRRGVVRVCVS